MKDIHLDHYDGEPLSAEEIAQLEESDVILIGTQRIFHPFDHVFYLDDNHQEQYGVLRFGEINNTKTFYITLEGGEILIIDAQERVYEDNRDKKQAPTGITFTP